MLDSENVSTGTKVSSGFHRFGTDVSNKNSFFCCMYEVLKNTNNNTLWSRSILIKMVNHKYFQEELLTFLNKGTLPFHFRDSNNNISCLQNYMKYILSDRQKHHKYFNDFFIQQNFHTKKILQDCFEMDPRMKNHFIVIFKLLPGSKISFKKLQDYLKKHEPENNNESYIEELLQQNTTMSINKMFKGKYDVSPGLKQKDQIDQENIIKIVCPTIFIWII